MERVWDIHPCGGGCPVQSAMPAAEGGMAVGDQTGGLHEGDPLGGGWHDAPRELPTILVAGAGFVIRRVSEQKGYMYMVHCGHCRATCPRPIHAKGGSGNASPEHKKTCAQKHKEWRHGQNTRGKQVCNKHPLRWPHISRTKKSSRIHQQQQPRLLRSGAAPPAVWTGTHPRLAPRPFLGSYPWCIRPSPPTAVLPLLHQVPDRPDWRRLACDPPTPPLAARRRCHTHPIRAQGGNPPNP